jgi:molybdate transport system substrate-binding protein
MTPSLPIHQTSTSQLHILCAGAMHRIIGELAGTLERRAGKPLAIRWASSGGVKVLALAGEAADVVITTAAAMDELARHHKILPMTVIPVARSPIGVAVRSGAPRPDVGSIESFKRALREARSIAIADPATGSPSGNHLVAVFERLAMTAELRA